MTILNKTPIMESSPPFIIFGIAIVIFLLGVVIDTIINSSGVIFFGSFIVAILVIIFGINIFFEKNEYETGRYKYEVILDENYSAQELYEKYNVIEQKGKIWVIEDKEPIDERINENGSN